MSTSTRPPSRLAQAGPSLSTDEIKRAFKQVKPQARTNRSPASISILQDTEAISSSDDASNTNLASKGLQAQAPTRHVAPASKRYSVYQATSRNQHGSQELGGSLGTYPRRRTIFIPDDVTVLSVDPAYQNDITLKQQHQSAPYSSPARSPLSSDHGFPQVPNFTIDRAGPDTEQENVPPGFIVNTRKETAVDASLAGKKVSSPGFLSKANGCESPASPRMKSASKELSKIDAKEYQDARPFKTSPAQQQTSRSKYVSSSSTKRKYASVDEDTTRMVRYEGPSMVSQEAVKVSSALAKSTDIPGISTTYPVMAVDTADHDNSERINEQLVMVAVAFLVSVVLTAIKEEHNKRAALKTVEKE